MRHVPSNRNVPGLTYFLTSVLSERQPLFAEPTYARLVIETLQVLRQRGQIRLYGYVVMPDHVHLVARPLPPVTAAQVMHRFKGFVAHACGQPVWMKGYWSEVLEGDQFLRQKIAYIHENPVRKGLTEAPETWPWSSAGEYASGVLTTVDAWFDSE